MEHVFAFFGLGGLAGIIVGVADFGFSQAWAFPQFFVIWAILLTICYGGFLILDTDGDFW